MRELVEEAGVIVLDKPDLFGVYHNKNERRDDYVAFYIVRDFEVQKNSYSSETAEKKWFPLNNLPHDVTPSTLRRIEEYLEKQEKSDTW
jgi:ADP-ribose pyrophosphatase YjhB (NUDIX family)